MRKLMSRDLAMRADSTPLVADLGAIPVALDSARPVV